MSKKISITFTAMAACAVLALSGCGGGSGTAAEADAADSNAKNTFVLGELWPQTGSLASMAPPEMAAGKLAVSDIDAAGGVLGNKVEVVSADVSDADHADQNSAAMQSVLSKEPSFIIGPASSAVVKNVYKTASAAKVPVLSMGATSSSFSGLDPYFFRTVAPDGVQGNVMGNMIVEDGVQNLAIAVFNDEYGTGLRDTVVDVAKGAGVNIVYGEKETFDPTETNFASIASAIKASKPDAVLVITFDQGMSVIKSLSQAGIDTHKLYLVDGNTSDFSSDFDKGLLKGSKGTIPGAEASEEFVKQLEGTGTDLKHSYVYAAETYDGIILAALAAEKAGDASGEAIAKNLPAVSGADGGEECTSYKDCLALLKDGKDIHYKGQTGMGPFNENHDPSTASIGVYVYDEDNKPIFDHVQSGEVPTE